MSDFYETEHLPPAATLEVIDPAAPLSRWWLNEVAYLFREMPYGDVVAFAEATGTIPPKIWRWAKDRK